MRPVFLDTSFLIALLATDDQHHGTAVELRRATRTQLVTTEYMLVEFADSLARWARDLAAATIASLRTDPQVNIVPAVADLFSQGLRLYESRPDKDWGLTDCISFAVMQQHGITDALTADRHFEQAGFRALLRSTLQ